MFCFNTLSSDKDKNKRSLDKTCVLVDSRKLFLLLLNKDSSKLKESTDNILLFLKVGVTKILEDRLKFLVSKTFL
jgi:hypothetical protein